MTRMIAELIAVLREAAKWVPTRGPLRQRISEVIAKAEEITK